ncbi:MAG: ABC transporter ATP-binding protein [Candidatus Hydrogenedentes bacterium]|nr:ABC transporter ATP-binding protein [Candidatus Hydrogenedentota bacterium]
MIDVQGITKFYGPIAAVQDVSFQVASGEIVGFLGPNGAGKSTTMRILTAFAPATRGEARIAGFEVHASPLEVKRRIGYLPERVPLYDEMVVSSFLQYVAELKGVEKGQRRNEVGSALERCGLSHMANRLIGNLSKGYRQRVGLAQALIGSPPVLILDEPTVGLDPAQIVEIRQMIRGLREKHTVLISTHILPEVAMLCERAIIINQGRVVAERPIENLPGEGGGTGLETLFLEAITADRAPLATGEGA